MGRIAYHGVSGTLLAAHVILCPGFAFDSPVHTSQQSVKHASAVAKNKDYLIGSLGFNEEKLHSAEEYTNILTLGKGVLEERAIWLQRRLSLTDNETAKITQNQPHILGRRSFTNLSPKIDYFQSRLLLDKNSLRKLVLRAPHILACSVEENIEPTLDWLQLRLGLTSISLSKMICRHPYTLGCSVTENLEPTLDWLQQRLDLGDEEISRLVQRSPNTLHLNIESNLEPKFDWLQQQLDLDTASLSKMVQRAPTILHLSIDNIEPKLEWLQGLSLTDRGILNIIQKFPSILSCNLDTNLEPTLYFYIGALGGNEREALALVTHNPNLFAYSLEKRLKPRLQEALNAGIVIDTSCLRRIGQYTDNQWQAELQRFEIPKTRD